MTDSDPVVYPDAELRRTPVLILLEIALTLLYVVIAALPGAWILVSFIEGNGGAAGIAGGVLFETVLGFIVWSRLHDAASLEYSGGHLSWRGSLPWAPRMRPGRVRSVRWPARRGTRRGQHLEIVLADGRKIAVDPGYGLMEFISAVRQHDPSVSLDIRPGAWWMVPRPDSDLDQPVREAAGRRVSRPVYRTLQVTARIMDTLPALAAALVILGMVSWVVLGAVGAQENFATLHSCIIKVRLPPGYHLTAQRQHGSDCRNACSVTQTWAWDSPIPRTTSASCADAAHALSRVFRFANPDSPLRPGQACAYFSQPDTFPHLGQGKLEIDAIVTYADSGRIAITLVSEYP